VAKHWIWKPIVAGACGAAVHSFLMFFKSRMGLLPSLQPYESLQNAFDRLVGSDVHPIVLCLLSFVSGATLVGFLFARLYCLLPGSHGAVKGLIFGLLGWTMMGFLLFPLLGLGFFAVDVGLGIAPALFSLAMLLTYGVVMGMVYAALKPVES
jgi:Family of unknown function (DUF6789)